MTIKSTLPDWLASAAAALRAGDLDGWMSLYAPDAVHEFPFAAEGAVRRLEGREAIAAYMNRLPERIRFGPLDDLRVREVGEELVVEVTGRHHDVASGCPRDIGYVWFITRRGDQVTHIRDYMGPAAPQRR